MKLKTDKRRQVSTDEAARIAYAYHVEGISDVDVTRRLDEELRPAGKRWYPAQVARMIRRAKTAAEAAPAAEPEAPPAQPWCTLSLAPSGKWTLTRVDGMEPALALAVERACAGHRHCSALSESELHAHMRAERITLVAVVPADGGQP